MRVLPLMALLTALLFLPLPNAGPGILTEPDRRAGDDPSSFPQDERGIYLDIPWVGASKSPQGLANALAENSHKFPSPEVLEARLQFTDADGAIRVVATVEAASQSVREHLQKNALQSVVLGDGGLVIARLTQEQLRTWVVHPAVTTIEPDFPLEFLAARSTQAIHARNVNGEGHGMWTYNATSDALEPPTNSSQQAITGKNVTVAIIDGGVDRTHPDFFEWGCDPRPIDESQPSVTFDAMPQEINDQLGRDVPCATRIDAAVVVSPFAHGEGFLAVDAAPPVDLSEGRLLPSTESPSSHGTHMAGVVAGNAYMARDEGGGEDTYGADGLPFGVAPEGRIVSVSMLNGDETSSRNNLNDMHTPWYTTAIAALQWTLDHAPEYDIRVVLNAWTCLSSNTDGDDATSCRGGDGVDAAVQAYDRIVERLYDAGIVTVTPVGNHHNEGDPVAFSIFAQNPHVIAVGATDWDGDHVARFSVPGLDGEDPANPKTWMPEHESDHQRRPDVMAPGVSKYDSAAFAEGGIWSARSIGGGRAPTPGQSDLASAAEAQVGRAALEDPYVEVKGTSVAAAHVAGAAALVLDACPKSSALDIMRATMAGANRTGMVFGANKDSAGPDRVGHGLINVTRSLDWISNEGFCIKADDNIVPIATSELNLRGRFPVRVGEPLNLQWSAKDSDGTLQGWEIQWGDGSVSTGNIGAPAATLNVNHTYSTAGDHVIRINITDGAGGLLHAWDSVFIPPPQEPSAPVLLDGHDEVASNATWDPTLGAYLVENKEIRFDPLVNGAAFRVTDTSIPVVIRNVTIIAETGAIDSPRQEDLEHNVSVNQSLTNDPAGYVLDPATNASASDVQQAANQSVQVINDTTARINNDDSEDTITIRLLNEINNLPETAPQVIEPFLSLIQKIVDPTEAVRVEPPGGWSNPPNLQSDGSSASYGVWLRNTTNVRLENVAVCWQRPESEPTDPSIEEVEPAAGFRIDESNNTTLDRVHACHTEDGIRLETSANVRIDRCTMEENRDGILMTGSHNNTVTGCRLEDNTRTGIRLDGASSRDNLIHDNILQRNAESNAFDAGETNHWNATIRPGPNVARGPLIGGNLWGKGGSDGECNQATQDDAGCPMGYEGDGFVDSTQNITGGNSTDLLPLNTWTSPQARFAIQVDGNTAVEGEYGPGNIVIPPGKTITFHDRSTDADGILREWNWTLAPWGTNHTVTDADIPPVAPPPIALDWGRYNISLDVTDNTGENHTHRAQLLADSPPQIDGLDTKPLSGFKVDVEAKVSDPDLANQSEEELKVTWNCGDGGTYHPGEGPLKGICDYHPDTGGKGAGWANITVTVADALNATVTKTQDIFVEAAKSPNVEFEPDILQPKTLETIRFIDQTQDNNPDTWTWDFGDPASTDPYQVTIEELTTACPDGFDSIDPEEVDFCPIRHPTHTYADNGTYTVTLNVTDKTGLSNEKTLDLTVHNRVPVSQFSFGVNPGDSVNKVTFQSQAHDLDGQIQEWRWDFGDPEAEDDTHSVSRNDVLADCGFVSSSCPLLQPNYTYSKVAAYDVELNVTDDDGNWSVAQEVVEIKTTPPVAEFSWTWDGQGTGSATPTTDDLIRFDARDSWDPDHDPPTHNDTITGWEWDFDDGTTSELQIVDHQYAKGGTYTVTLRVQDSRGAKSEELAMTTITIGNVGPLAGFSYYPPNPTTTETIEFEDLSMDSDGSIVSWEWDFGDGTTSTEQNPSHVFYPAPAGTYTVGLNVTDDQGDQHEFTLPVLVKDTPPEASFTWTTEAGQPITDVPIAFTSATTDPDGDSEAIRLHWDFGDGTTSHEQHPMHSYKRGGDYKVRLIATDENGTKAIDSSWLEVRNRLPEVQFATDPTQPLLGAVIRFEAMVEDPEGADIITWSWDFGDGAVSTQPEPNHTFTTPGEFPVTLTVIDEDGGLASTTNVVTIRNQPPTTGISINGSNPFTFQEIEFTAQSTDQDGEIIAWSWDFGDGERSQQRSPLHSYKDDGEYQIALTVTDDAGDTNSTTMTILVKNRPPKSDFQVEPMAPIVQKETLFLGTASDQDGRITRWEWDFGDGNTSTQKTPLHAYASPGIYKVNLTVSDDDGATNSSTLNLTVNDPAPSTEFEYDVEGSTATFQVPEAPESDWAWDFGDGTAGNGTNPTHSYAKKGAYVVTLQSMKDGEVLSSTTAIIVVDQPNGDSPDTAGPPTKKTPAPSMVMFLLAALAIAWQRKRRHE